MAEPWLSAADIGAYLGVTKETVYSWIALRAMPAHKVGRLWKFQSTEVDEWVRRGGAAATQPAGGTTDGRRDRPGSSTEASV